MFIHLQPVWASARLAQARAEDLRRREATRRPRPAQTAWCSAVSEEQHTGLMGLGGGSGPDGCPPKRFTGC